MSGNASSVNRTAAGSPPAFPTDWRTVVSPMLLRVLTATVLPPRSPALVMSLPSGTTTPLKSLPSSPVE
jgi:hypothetical protein